MELAIALGIPLGFYKVNNDNLNLIRPPLKNCGSEPKLVNGENKVIAEVKDSVLIPEKTVEDKEKLFSEKPDPWESNESDKKLEDDSFWLQSKVEDSWTRTDDTVKTLSTKFEPNLSTKLLESSNDSIDDVKYEEPVQLLQLESTSKDTKCNDTPEAVNASSDSDRRTRGAEISDIVVEKSQERLDEEKASWNENSQREDWEKRSDIVGGKPSSEIWNNGSSGVSSVAGKDDSHLWNDNSNITSCEKVNETNSEFLDSLLSAPNPNEFLTNESGSFLSENIELMNEKNENVKAIQSVVEVKEKSEWGSNNDHRNYIRVWNAEKNSPWSKEGSILESSVQERLPGVRTANRLPSTPETNGTMSFSIPNRRNSISDFSNINLESNNMDVVLPPAKTLIKECMKTEERKFDLKESSFLESSESYKVKDWDGESSKQDFSSTNVNSEDLMKIALESLASQHHVITVPSSTFDSAMGILNQTQEAGNLNLFSGGESDGLDFNLPLPDHLLRTNFSPNNFQTTCASNFQGSESQAFLSTTNNIFGTTCTLSNSVKFDHFEGNFTHKKSKSLDDVMEFFDPKSSFNGYEGHSEGSSLNNFSFGCDSGHVEGFNVGETLQHNKRKKPRPKKTISKRILKSGKKLKNKKGIDYPKTNTIESIINEALFDSCVSNAKPLQMEDSSPDGTSVVTNPNENYSLPIISESLDEVENLDFLAQD